MMGSEYRKLSGAEFIGEVLDRNRDFERISLPDGTDLRQEKSYAALKGFLKDRHPHLNFQNSSLPGLTLYGLELPKADFSGADLTNARFLGGWFKEAIFKNANLENAEFQRLKLRRKNPPTPEFDFAKFDGSHCVGAKFEGVSMYGARFTGANLEGADFSRMDLSGANLKHAGCKNANFSEAYLGLVVGADFEGANFTETDLRNTIGLDKANGLDNLVLNQTVVTPKEKEIIIASNPERYAELEGTFYLLDKNRIHPKQFKKQS